MGEAWQLNWELAQAIGISLGIGGLVGLERQQQEEHKAKAALGIRTFALTSLLGTLTVLAANLSEALVYVIGISFGLIMMVRYVAESRLRDPDIGVTTEVAALLVFVLGMLVPSRPLLASSVAVLTVFALAIKGVLHGFVAKLSRKEVVATAKFLLVTVVVLPLLPDQTVDPWGIYNPREIWLLVILISAIGFVGYFAMRFLGKSRGIVLTGGLGGLASSTAVTMAMSEWVARHDLEKITRAAGFAVILANTIMAVRVMIEVTAVNASLLSELAVPIGALTTTGLVVSGVFLYPLREDLASDEQTGLNEPDLEPEEAGEGGEEEAEEDTDSPEGAAKKAVLKNPFQFKPALKFAALFLGILGLVYVASTYFGDKGTYAAALISGLADADAISIAIARMESSGEIGAALATRAITMAVLSNTLTKAGICAVIGSLQFGLRILLGLLPMIFAGAGALVAMYYL